jgi:hypothetical protein
MIQIIVAMLLSWEQVFKQKRSAYKAIGQAIRQMIVIGRRTIARSWLIKENSRDWSSQYKLNNRSKWEAQKLFRPIIGEAIWENKGKFIAIAVDDTKIKKSGKKIQSARWQRDAMSAPFHLNLQWGLRYLHAAILLPLHQKYGVSARAIPILFQEVPAVKKPGKQASEEEKEAYKKEIKTNNLSVKTVEMMKEMRKEVDERGAREKLIAWTVDGSFCNKTVFKAEVERGIVIARGRKDAKLCFENKQGRAYYSKEKFTPEEVLRDEKIPFQEAEIFHGAKFRKVFYKEVVDVLWQRGAGKKKLRLIVVRPTPYRKTKRGRILYRQPAFLFTTDLLTDAVEILQIYFDRWQIEVSHKELKQHCGLGQAQVRNPLAVSRQPVLQVATYSSMHLAALQLWGPHFPDLLPLPKYQRDKSRVSAQDLIRFLRDEVVFHPETLPFDFEISAKSLLDSATL